MLLLLPSLVITAYAISIKSWLAAIVGAVILLPVELYLAGTPRFSWAIALPAIHFAVAPCLAKNKQVAAWVLLALVTIGMVAIMYLLMLSASNNLMASYNLK